MLPVGARAVRPPYRSSHYSLGPTAASIRCSEADHDHLTPYRPLAAGEQELRSTHARGLTVPTPAQWKLASVIGKEGLAAFARELAALHRPIEFDWAAKFGLSQAPAAAPAATRPSNATRPDGRTRPWFVKFDGPCSRCGRTLVKGIEAVWSSRQRRMFCLECARSLSD